jgi:PAS domain S-box-containing protein
MRGWRAWSIAVLIALATASVLAALMVLQQGEARAQGATEDRADRAAVALDRLFSTTSASLDGVRGLFEADRAVSSAQFEAYAARIMGEPSLSGISFTAAVSDAARADYERRLGRPILDWGPGGPQRAARRAHYYPVTYLVTQLGRGSEAIGLDVGNDPSRLDALEAARDSGEDRASAPVPLFGSRDLAALVYEPIYAHGVSVRTVAERRAALVGFAVGVFRIERLGAQVLAQMPAGTQLQVFDGDTQVFGPRGQLADAEGRDSSLSGRRWRLVVSSSAPSWGFPAAVLIGGLLLTGLVGLLMRQALRRERYALGLVERRLREQRAVEEALRDREAQLAEAQRIAQLGSWEWDVPGDLIRWSDELCRLFGVPPEGFQASYQEYLGRLHPDDRGPADEVIRRAMADGAPFSLHHRVMHPDGTIRVLHGQGRVECDGDGRLVRMLGTAQDVTEARRAEQELRRQRDYAAGLVTAMRDGLIVLSPEGVVSEASPSFCALTGFSRTELIEARAPYPYWPTASRERVDGGLARLDAEGAAEWDVEFRHRDGHSIPVILSAFVLRDAQGAVIGYPATVKDMTERQAVQQIKDEFVALASHELRTPLTSVIGYLEVVLEDDAGVGPLNAQQRRFLRVAERNAQKLLRLVGDLLVIARGDAGRLTLDLDEIDLAAIARECGESARSQAEERGLTLRVHAEPVQRFVADSARIVQVLDNLLSNALKFTPPGGQVELRTGVRGEEALLEVSDTGIGITPAEQVRLFERFYRTSAATREAIPGTGLGLAISKMIIEAHNGRIAVQSHEGRGSTFSVAFPLARGPGSHSRKGRKLPSRVP